MSLLQSMLTALALTLAAELLFSLLWGLKKRELLLVVLMNILTNPVVNLLYFMAVQLLGWQSIGLVLLLEAGAVVAEALCCRGMIRRPWLFALLANLFSFGIGEILQRI